jgi:hypothetical protein
LDRLTGSVVDLGCVGSRFLVAEVVVEGSEVIALVVVGSEAGSVVVERSEVAVVTVVAMRRTGRRGRRLERCSS